MSSLEEYVEPLYTPYYLHFTDSRSKQLAQFRKIRGHETIPTVWEILSKTFTEDLFTERNQSSHEPKSDDSEMDHQVGYSSRGGNRNNQEPGSLNMMVDGRPPPGFDNRYPQIPYTCPYLDCNITLKAGSKYMRRHFLSHTENDGNFRCSRCSFDSTTLRALKK